MGEAADRPRFRLPARFGPLPLGFFLAGLMSLIVAGVGAGLLADWLTAWSFAWAIAFPTVLLVAPFVRGPVARLVDG